VYNIHDLGEHNGHCVGALAYRKLIREVGAAGLRGVEVGLCEHEKCEKQGVSKEAKSETFLVVQVGVTYRW
jgi:hypothetical protein